MDSRHGTVTLGQAPKALLQRHRFAEPIQLTRSPLPPLDDYRALLERVWATHWLTNQGELHGELEARLSAYLGVERLSLCANGTISLLIALHARGIDGGEVITTPFTFPATPHALHWNRVRPVFCDIDEETFNLDAGLVEDLIGPETRAILPVHVFGTPCDVEAIAEIANRHDLAVVYDAAHAMGVTYHGRSVLEWGDLSILSFHATKAFTTAEGGAIVSGSDEMRARVQSIRNFGIANEETVIGPGINGKLSEFHAALGLLQLDRLDSEIVGRRALTELYRQGLREIPGLRLAPDFPNVRHNYAYFPVLVDPARFGMDRDRLCDVLREFNVFPRKYFYPMASHYEPYASLPSANPARLPVAERVASRILCLPLYGELAKDDIESICTILVELQAAA